MLLIALPFVTTVIASAVGRSREISWRIKCGSNLSQMGKALLIYNSDFIHPPRTIYVPDAPLAYFTNPAAANPSAAGGPVANDVTAAVYLLIRTIDVMPDVFVCPSANNIDRSLVGANIGTRSNFQSRAAQSYSWTNPYPTAAAVKAGYDYDVFAGIATSSEAAIAADMNPGTAVQASATTTAPSWQMRAVNGLNHHQDGQNVLFGDGHVEFVQNPFVGVARDNIYASVTGGTDPSSATDSVLPHRPRWPAHGANDTVDAADALDAVGAGHRRRCGGAGRNRVFDLAAPA